MYSPGVNRLLKKVSSQKSLSPNAKVPRKRSSLFWGSARAKRGRWSPAGACLRSPARDLGRSGRGEAPDPAPVSGGAASWRLHIHPAHPDNRLRFHYTLKVSGLGWGSKVRPASGQQHPPPTPASAPGRSPGKAESCPRLQLPGLFWGHSDRSGFTSMCSWQRKQKKATSLIIKRHLRLIGKPRGPWTGPPADPPAIRPEGGPPSETEFATAPGSFGPTVQGGGGLREPYLPPHPGRPGNAVQLKSKRGWRRRLPEMQFPPSENCSEGPGAGRASKQTARGEPRRVYLQND